MLRPDKTATIKATLSLTPEYTKLFRDFQKKGCGIFFPPEIAARQNCFGSYVKNYDSELKIGMALMLAIFGADEFHKLNAELKDASPAEQQKFIDEIAVQDDWNEIMEQFQIPETAQEWEDARKQLELLPPDEKLENEQRGAYFWAYFFGSFFNLMSLMVHGEKLTALVPKAISGDDNAFLKAAQTDRMLLRHHPYFIERKLRAQNEGDKKFLFRLANHEATPVLNGKIQFPGLYMLFGILEAFRWLDNLSAPEILDICISNT